MKVDSLSGWPQALADLGREGSTLGFRVGWQHVALPDFSAAPAHVLSEKWDDAHSKPTLGGISVGRQPPVSACVNTENWHDNTGGVSSSTACGFADAMSCDLRVLATGFDSTAPTSSDEKYVRIDTEGNQSNAMAIRDVPRHVRVRMIRRRNEDEDATEKFFMLCMHVPGGKGRLVRYRT